ncbi:hypothetical protein E4U54_006403 [Claviceps lovelessii]|nr:hypothetical protein E4U54_006403 [Claviceps lovelessii]
MKMAKTTEAHSTTGQEVTASSSDAASSSSPPPYPASEPKVSERPVGDVSQFKGGFIQFELFKHPETSEWRAGPPEWHQCVAKREPWYGLLTLYVHDVSHMMEHGLHFSSKNVDPRGSLIADDGGPEMTPYTKSLGWTHYRRFVLRDLDQENPQWKGFLIIYSRGIKELSHFRVDGLSFRNIRFARAKVGQNLVYNFDCVSPENNYNTIFDDMPMQGWWPWPNPEATKQQNDQNMKAKQKEKPQKRFSISYYQQSSFDFWKTA